MNKISRLTFIPITGIIFSCSTTENITNTKPSVIINKSPESNPSLIVSSAKPRPSSSISASPVSVEQTPLSKPTEVPFREVSDITIYYPDGNNTLSIASSKSYYDYYSYSSIHNQSELFTAKVNYKDKGIMGSDKIIWKSSDESVISINNGVLTSLKNGAVKISAYPESDKSKVAVFYAYVYDSLTSQYTVGGGCGSSTEIRTIKRDKFVAHVGWNGVNEPLGQTGSTSDSKERATFNGRVYDPNNVPVEGAKVSARSTDPGVDWVGEEQVTIGGAYVFRNAPIGARIAITVSKDGWTTRERREVLNSNLCGDPTANVFNFNDLYAIQDEPEITALKVNGRQVLGATSGASASTIGGTFTITPAKYTNVTQLTSSIYNPSLTGVANNTLEVEMSFSEPVRRDDVENYFRVSSQQFNRTVNNVNTTKTFTIDQNLAGVGFTWANDYKSVIFKTNKAILANKEGEEARYAVEFTQAFRDKTDKAAKSQRYFRFSPSQINNFAAFSVKNDDQAPALLSILARDGGPSVDTLELRFSEPMEVINQSSVAAGLADPASASDTTRQLYAFSTNNINGNNATILGYKNSSGNFIASYVIGRVLSADINNSVATKTVKLSALGSATNAFPTAITQYAGTDTFGYRLRSARITGNTVLIELTPQAFDRDDRVIAAVGTNIISNYSDRTNNVGPINLSPLINVPIGSEFASIQDPSGRLIDGGNSTTSANIDVNNQQRVSTVN